MNTRLRFSVVLELCLTPSLQYRLYLYWNWYNKLNSFISEGIIIFKRNMRRRFYKMLSANILCVCGALYLSVKDVFHVLDMSPLPRQYTETPWLILPQNAFVSSTPEAIGQFFFSIFICSCSILISSCGTLLYKHIELQALGMCRINNSFCLRVFPF